MKPNIPLPSIFDGKGAFRELDEADFDALPDANKAAYQTVRRCAAELKTADGVVADSIKAITVAADAVAEWRQHMEKTFPKITYHDLWRANFSRK